MIMSLTKPATPTWTEELLRTSLLSEELIDIRFHLFSGRSKSSARVRNPRTLHANAVLLKKSANYFMDLLDTESSLSGTVLMDVKLDDEIFNGLTLDDYGYESDSDLEDNDGDENQDSADDDADKDDSDSNSFVSASADSVKDYDLLGKGSSDSTPAGSSTKSPAIHKPGVIAPIFDKKRHIFIKDTAFQTWYCLLYYLYTGTVHLLPPQSTGKRGSQEPSLDPSKEPRCSAKSMFRLASKLNLEELREHAFNTITECLDEDNLLQELAGSFAGRYSRVLELELDLLLQKIATPPIVEGLPTLMRRISQKELPHGADVIIGLHTRILRLHYARELAQIRPSSPHFASSKEENGIPMAELPDAADVPALSDSEQTFEPANVVPMDLKPPSPGGYFVNPSPQPAVRAPTLPNSLFGISFPPSKARAVTPPPLPTIQKASSSPATSASLKSKKMGARRF